MALPSANTIMRLQYLESEKGGQLRIDSTTPGFSGVKAYDGSLAIGPNATLSQIETHCANVDPTITSAT
jgi:hypothetical protein